jgi:hypothetical protein
MRIGKQVVVRRDFVSVVGVNIRRVLGKFLKVRNIRAYNDRGGDVAGICQSAGTRHDRDT